MGWLIGFLTLRWLAKPVQAGLGLFVLVVAAFVVSIVVYSLFGDASVPYLIGGCAAVGGALGVAVSIFVSGRQ